jgi:hypothetical protein
MEEQLNCSVVRGSYAGENGRAYLVLLRAKVAFFRVFEARLMALMFRLPRSLRRHDCIEKP